MTRKTELTAEKSQTNNQLFGIERNALLPEDAQKIAARLTDYNDSCSDKRNFKCLEFK